MRPRSLLTLLPADLHFKKKHQKSVNRLVLSEEQLAKRQQMYDDIEAPKAAACSEITDALGSGCFLSTLSRRECVVDAEPLWIYGRVDRSGGAQVSNPELINIQLSKGTGSRRLQPACFMLVFVCMLCRLFVNGISLTERCSLLSASTTDR